MFDPDAYKQSTRAQWQETAEAWHRWGPTLERWLGPATELMLDQAGVVPGARSANERDRARACPSQRRTESARYGAASPRSARGIVKGKSLDLAALLPRTTVPALLVTFPNTGPPGRPSRPTSKAGRAVSPRARCRLSARRRCPLRVPSTRRQRGLGERVAT